MTSFSQTGSQPAFGVQSLPAKVLMTAGTVGGVWTYAMELARGLASVGIRVSLATMGAPLDPQQRSEAAAVPGLVLHESSFKLEWMQEPWDEVSRAGRWLLDIADAERPDLVHLNAFAHGALGWRVPCVVVGHSCVASWWRAVRGGSPPPEWDLYRAAVARGLRGADIIVAPSQAMLDALEESYGRLASARVIPNGRDPQAFTPQFKQRFVIGAGRLWDEAKNVVTLARAAERIDWPVCVAGETRGPDGTEAPLEGIRYLGKLAPSDLARWFGRAAIFAQPARYEPFGLSALEAGLSGCALVLGDIASQREIWGDTASFVPPSDPGALADALQLLITDPERRRTMAESGRRRALEYTTDRMTYGYLNAYADAAAAHKRRGSGTQPTPGARDAAAAQVELSYW